MLSYDTSFITEHVARGNVAPAPSPAFQIVGSNAGGAIDFAFCTASDVACAVPDGTRLFGFADPALTCPGSYTAPSGLVSCALGVVPVRQRT